MDEKQSGDEESTSLATLTAFVKDGLLTVDNKGRRQEERDPKYAVAIKATARYFSRWHQARFNSPLPDADAVALSEELLVSFIVDHIDLVAYGSQVFEESFDLEGQVVRQQMLLAALADEAARRDQELPTVGTLQTHLRHLQLAYEGRDRSAFESKKVRRLRLMLMEAAETGGRVHVMLPLIGENLAAVLNTCDDTYSGLRDRALIFFALSVGEFPATAVKNILFEHLDRMPDGSFQFDYRAAGIKARHSGLLPV